MYLNGRLEATGKGVSNPNFKKISKAFNINYNVIKNHKDLIKLDKIIKSKKAEFVEIILKPNQKLYLNCNLEILLKICHLCFQKRIFKNMEIKTIIRDKKIFEAN